MALGNTSISFHRDLLQVVRQININAKLEKIVFSLEILDRTIAYQTAIIEYNTSCFLFYFKQTIFQNSPKRWVFFVLKKNHLPL